MNSDIAINKTPTLTNGIVEFRFRPQQKDAVAFINRDGIQHKVVFNFQTLLDAMTATQKTTVRTWYKKCAALAMNALNVPDGATPIDDTAITGEAFDDA